MKDYYKVLGVPRTASATQIKQAYRILVKQFHPDINQTSSAAERTKQLNEAWAALSDPQKKMSYDMDIKTHESGQQNSASSQGTSTKRRTESASPRPEPNFSCEKCGRIDSTLRVSATWRVYSFINYSRKSPTVKILCCRCRLKESLAASAVTVLLGWWSIWGFFWTLEALFNNARGGEQPIENNAALLNALAYQLYKAGRRQEAYEALVSALKLKPDTQSEQMRDYLKQQLPPIQKKTFWERFRKLELHPAYYHAPAGVIVSFALFFWIHALDATESSNTSTAYTPRARPPAQQHVGFTPVDIQPAFNEPEQPLPEQDNLLLSDRIVNYTDTTAPLKITTRESDGNYVMKVVDWNSGEFVAMYFIRRGSTLSIELPLGFYKLKFASGDKWYGMKYLFGPTTAYSYVPDKMVFYISGDYVQGHRLELIPQVGGNLETPAMRATDW